MAKFDPGLDDVIMAIIRFYLANPVAAPIGTIAVYYGIRNPTTRSWTIRMLIAHGKNVNRFILRGITDTALITWSETLGARGVKRRAAKRVGQRAARRAAAMGVGRKVTGRYLLKRTAKRAIPFIGWGIAIYDVVDYLIGDDPSLIGDIEDWVSG